MTTTELTRGREIPPDTRSTVRHYLGGRRGLLVAGAVVIVAGIAFNWGWLVAAGVAPLLLSVLPCVAMCALGICMHRMTGGSSGSQQSATSTTHEETGPVQLAAPSDDSGAATLAESASVRPIRATDKSCCQSAR